MELKNNITEYSFLVNVSIDKKSIYDIEDELKELELLANTAGTISRGKTYQLRKAPSASTYIGKGKINTIIEQAIELDCSIIIFNNEISPTQIKNLQKIAGDKIKIIDRTGLILDIFTKHAKTKEAKTQVHLAQLEYMLPRLTRQWTHLERQMGGVGTRAGAGETQIEVDRRLIRNQISKLEKELKKIEKQRVTQNASRSNSFRISLVGYTNAGKSTLMHALTQSNILIEDKLFATLDTTTRKLKLNCSKSIIISDTVGFIQNLPHDLIASFKSTLNEIRDVDLLLKTYDISSKNLFSHIEIVNEVLSDLNIKNKKALTVFNKIDLIDQNKLLGLKKRFKDAIFISSTKNVAIDSLKNHITAIVKEDYIKDTILIPYSKSNYINIFYTLSNVISKKFKNEGTELTIESDKITIKKLRNILK